MWTAQDLYYFPTRDEEVYKPEQVAVEGERRSLGRQGLLLAGYGSGSCAAAGPRAAPLALGVGGDMALGLLPPAVAQPPCLRELS